MPASAQSVDTSGSDLFGAMTAGGAIAAAPAPAAGSASSSADLFDLMGPTQSVTSSQSLNFSMSSTQSLSTTVLPQSRSQVCMIALLHTCIFINNSIMYVSLRHNGFTQSISREIQSVYVDKS